MDLLSEDPVNLAVRRLPEAVVLEEKPVRNSQALPDSSKPLTCSLDGRVRFYSDQPEAEDG